MKFNATATEEVSSQAGRPCLPAVQPEQGSPGAWPCSHAPHPALAPEDRFNLQCPASWACWGKRGPEPCSAPKAEWPALQRVAEASPSCPGTRGARITCRERKEARLAGADGDQQLSPFWPSWTHTYAEHSPPPPRAVFQSKGGREGEGCPQSACAYWLAPWGCVQSSRQGPALCTHPQAHRQQGKDGEPGVLPNHSGLTGSLESGVLPGSARSLQGVQKTAVASLGQGKWWV